MFSCGHMKTGYLVNPCLRDHFCVSRRMSTQIAQKQCAGLELERPPPNILFSKPFHKRLPDVV